MMSRFFSPGTMRLLCIALLLGIFIGTASAFQYSGYCDQGNGSTRGSNGSCTTVGSCGWGSYCIQQSCTVNGQQVQNGCWPPGWIMQCQWAACFNWLQGNCSC